MSPIRARSGAALRRLRRGALTPRRLAFRLGGRRVVAAVDPPRGVARVSVRPTEGAAAAGRPARRLVVRIGRRRIAASFDRAAGSVELKVVRPGAAARRRPSPPRPAEPPPEPSIAFRPLVVEPPPLTPPPEPESEPEPPRRGRAVVWVGAVTAGLVALMAGAGAGVLFTHLRETEHAAIDVPSTTASTRPPPQPARLPPATSTRAARPKPTPTPKPKPKPKPATTSSASPSPKPTTTAPAQPQSTTVVAGTTHAVTTPKPPTSSPPASTRVLRWKPVPGARLYLFEVLREGSLGRIEVLEAWPTAPQFHLPATLEPGVYLWSASPQSRRGATVRSTSLTRAGRFHVTEGGRLVLLD